MGQRDRLRRRREFSQHDYRDDSDGKRADKRRHEPLEPLRRADRNERGRHRRGDPEFVPDGEYEIQAESQEHARHHAHHDRHRHRFHRPSHPTDRPSASIRIPVAMYAPITSL